MARLPAGSPALFPVPRFSQIVEVLRNVHVDGTSPSDISVQLAPGLSKEEALKIAAGEAPCGGLKKVPRRGGRG